MVFFIQLKEYLYIIFMYFSLQKLLEHIFSLFINNYLKNIYINHAIRTIFEIYFIILQYFFPAARII